MGGGRRSLSLTLPASASPFGTHFPGDDQYRSASAFGSRHAAPPQAAIGGRPTTAADDLELLLRSVSPIQKFLDELLKAHFGVGFTGRRLLQELVDLDHLPARRGKSWCFVWKYFLTLTRRL